MNETTLRYVRQHADDDVRMLALRGSKDPQLDLQAALQQIKGRQTARRKLPSWAANDDLLYGSQLAMEQCSSEAAGRYKAEVLARLGCMRSSTMQHGATDGIAQPTLMVDLTGGLGVDFSFMAPLFGQAVYVERQEALCQLARHNFKVLGLEQAEVVCADGTNYLKSVEHATLIFLDPARRDEHGDRTYGLADCTPDVLLLRDELLSRADRVMLKLSPMLDWRKTVDDLGRGQVREVHIVSVGGECKELLLVLSREGTGLRLVCANDESRFDIMPDDAWWTADGSTAGSQRLADWSPHTAEGSLNPSSLYLYEPNASVMKAGCFGALCERFGVEQIAQNSHLFVAPQPVEGFPGRGFRLLSVVSMNKKELRTALRDVRQANMAVRNFPLSVAELRKRLKISEGGSTYIFATTLAHGDHVLLLCEKIL